MSCCFSRSSIGDIKESLRAQRRGTEWPHDLQPRLERAAHRCPGGWAFAGPRKNVPWRSKPGTVHPRGLTRCSKRSWSKMPSRKSATPVQHRGPAWLAPLAREQECAAGRASSDSRSLSFVCLRGALLLIFAGAKEFQPTRAGRVWARAPRCSQLPCKFGQACTHSGSRLSRLAATSSARRRLSVPVGLRGLRASS